MIETNFDIMLAEITMETDQSHISKKINVLNSEGIDRKQNMLSNSNNCNFCSKMMIRMVIFFFFLALPLPL